MKHKISCLSIICIITIASLCACDFTVAPPSSVTSEKESSEDVSGGTTEIDAESFSIGDIDSIEGTSAYVDRDGICTTLFYVSDYGHSVGGLFSERGQEMWVDYVSGDVYPLENSDGQLKQFTQVSPSNGDRIITTINESAGYYPVFDVGYYGGSSYSVDQESEINGVTVGEIDPSSSYAERVSQILEENGIEYIKTTNSSIENLMSGFYSSTETSLTFGHYSGTKWQEETIEINVPCYVFAGYHNFIDLPVEKTKDGYFVIDYSSLDSGKYMLRSGNASFLIEII